MTNLELTPDVVEFYYAACRQQTENAFECFEGFVTKSYLDTLKEAVSTTNPQTVLDSLKADGDGDGDGVGDALTDDADNDYQAASQDVKALIAEVERLQKLAALTERALIRCQDHNECLLRENEGLKKLLISTLAQ